MDRIFWKEIFYSLSVLAYATASFFSVWVGEAKGKEVWYASDKGYLADSYHYPGHVRRDV